MIQQLMLLQMQDDVAADRLAEDQVVEGGDARPARPASCPVLGATSPRASSETQPRWRCTIFSASMRPPGPGRSAPAPPRSRAVRRRSASLRSTRLRLPAPDLSPVPLPDTGRGDHVHLSGAVPLPPWGRGQGVRSDNQSSVHVRHDEIDAAQRRGQVGDHEAAHERWESSAGAAKDGVRMRVR